MKKSVRPSNRLVTPISAADHKVLMHERAIASGNGSPADLEIVRQRGINLQRILRGEHLSSFDIMMANPRYALPDQTPLSMQSEGEDKAAVGLASPKRRPNGPTGSGS